MRVLMLPHLQRFRSEESGIKRVVEAYHKHGPPFGIEFVGEGDRYDLKVSHAGTNTDNIDVAMLHGLYWTSDYASAAWEWKANSHVISAARQARIITVPSEWVAEVIRRDMRRNPVVVGHGIDAQDWEHDRPMGGYVLWNKNRSGVDVCDPADVGVLAHAYRKTKFVTTFGPKRRRNNIEVTGVIPHDQMKLLLQGAAVYLSTTKETFGIGTLEAMAAGVPVLGYANGGNLDLIQHGINGYLAEPRNEEDLIEGLGYCLKHRKTLGDNGKEMVKEFTWEQVMEKVAGVFADALEDKPPTVAIVIPSFNYADKVGRAIESALRQTYNNVKEIVVVDDGSGDNTSDVVQEWQDKDNRIQYIWQDNQGVAVARNNGIASTDTKYVSCLDADDAMEPEFIEKCVRALERDHSLGLVYTKIRHVLPDGRTGVSPWPGEWDFDNQLKRRNQVPTCNVFRRDVWQALGGYKKRYCPLGAGSEDAEFWTRIGAYGWKCKLATAEPLFIYSLGSGRVSGNKEYTEPDWLAWHPWVEDGQHPLASYATPKRWSHPVRQYDEPVVSVVIPVGPGHEDVVEDAIDSVEAQTLRQWECIVVWDRDDYPPQRYIDAYPFVNWINTGRGQGAGFARNIGAKFARAPFLLFLDADDRLYFNALDRMLDEWKVEEAVIYSDYVGKAFIEDIGGLSEKLQRNIQWRDEDGLTVIRYETPEYDVARAQRQPSGDPRRVYTWNLISSLVPKAWHEEIHGFDEQMESWEDVDYFWRLAKAGKCFRRVPEPLVVYSFYTGNRRDRGLEKHQELFEYLIDKHEKEDVTMCRGCGSRRKTVSTRPSATSRLQTSPTGPTTPPLQLQDEQFQLAVYNHPNRGQHTVVGQALFRDRVEGVHMVRDRNNQGWYIHYGFRGGGEKFLVHREDIQIAPHLFMEVETRPSAPVVSKAIPEPPTPLSEPEGFEEEAEGAPPPAPQRIDLDSVIGDKPVADNGYDLQKLPGVTARIAKKLGDMTLEQILEKGEQGLQEIDGIGPTRAASIIRAATERVNG